MKTNNEDYVILLEHQATLITCEDCGFHFIIYSVIKGDGTEDNKDMVFTWGTFNYCPYCGHKVDK